MSFKKMLPSLIVVLALLSPGCTRTTVETTAASTPTAPTVTTPASTAEAPTISVSTTDAPTNPASTADAPSVPASTDTESVPPSEPKDNGSDGFVLLAEAVPDVIQEVRYYTTYNFVGARIDGYEEPCILLTKEAAQALKAVSDDVMAQGYRLKVYDGYRPQMAVDHFVRWAEDLEATEMKPYFYPEVDKSQLFKQGYIAAKSGHSRGSTLDLTLFDMATGKEVDMGGTFDYFGLLSHPDYTGALTQAQIDNRMLLRDAMLRHGFKALSTEWWHFTLVNEPYPHTYFNFPVNADSVQKLSPEENP